MFKMSSFIHWCALGLINLNLAQSFLYLKTVTLMIKSLNVECFCSSFMQEQKQTNKQKTVIIWQEQQKLKAVVKHKHFKIRVPEYFGVLYGGI